MAERGCYNCGQYGHIKRDCPELRCYYCNERGHFSRSCPRRYPSRKVPTGSPSPGGDVKVCVLDINQPSLPTLFTLFLCLFLSYGPFTCIWFHKFSRQLCLFSLCSFSLISALLVLSTIYLFLKVSLNGFRDPARLSCAAIRVGGGRDPGDWGTHWLRPVGANTSLWPGLLLHGWLGWPDPINRLVVLSSNLWIRRQRLGSIGG